MSNTIEKARADYKQATGRLAQLLAKTPDDRLNWSPSPSARTPIQLAAHSAEAIKNIQGFLEGHPFEITDTAKADDFFRDWEKQFTTREQVVSLLEKTNARYLAFLDALTPDRLDTLVELPFGLGKAPLAIGLTFAPNHTQTHIAQLEYIQTIYGDHDWYLAA